MKEFLECGKIVSTHGVRGEVKAEVWMDSPEEMTALKTLYLDGGKTPLPEYGKLCDITETGANRVYHIRFADGKVRLAPDIPQVVLRLAPEEGVIEIRPLAGLFDDVTEDDYEV